MGALEGRVALVTGASRNIGRAIAIALAEQGAKVIVHTASDRNAGLETLEAVRRVDSEGALVCAGFDSPQSVRGVVEEAAGHFSRLDMLINNAAIRPEAAFSDITYENWRQVMSVALDAVFLASQAALPHLIESNQAAIVNIGGLTGHTGANNRAHVIAAKAGVVGLTKAMAHDLADDGITVNCVSPGLISTARDSAAGQPHHHGHRSNLLGRRGLPEEVAATTAYLCGPAARYVTGQTWHINGGAYLP